MKKSKLVPPRKKEARFAATEDEHTLIRRAAKARHLLHSTYMRVVVLSQARLDTMLDG